MTKFLHIAAVAATMVAGGTAQAANIIWQTPTNATGNASDVTLFGSLVAAVNTGPTTTVNGVTFTSGFTAPITLSGVAQITNIYSFPNFSNPSYNALVGTGAYAESIAPLSITLSGLTTGKVYLVQLFAPFWNNNWATAFTGGASTSGLVNLTGPDVGAGASSVPQYVIGTFTADSTSQLITTSTPTAYTLVASAQLRAVPEPASWVMMIAGMGLVGFAARRRQAAVAA